MCFWRKECHVEYFFFTPLVNYWSIETIMRRDPPKIKLFTVNRKMKSIKEDEINVRLFL